MTWYAAHIIIGMVRSDGKATPISVWENVILLEAATFDEARIIADKMGKQEEETDDELTINGVAATRIFAGVRKILTISNPVEVTSLDQSPPVSGTEITYSVFEVPDMASLQKLAEGKNVQIKYLE